MIDSHIHLNHERYNDDRDVVIKRSLNEGVNQVIQIGCDRQSIIESIELKKQYDNFINLALGWHPVDCTTFDLDFLKQKISENKIVAIGEIGLDYHWYPEQKQIQIEVFQTQIDLAKKLDLPIIVHCRNADQDCLKILQKNAPLKGVMHSYAAGELMLQQFLDTGLHVSFSGPITFKNGDNQKSAAKICPLDKMLIETDGPYLTPAPYRGKRNESINIKYVAQEIAFIRDMSLDEVLNITEENTIKLFGLESNV